VGGNTIEINKAFREASTNMLLWRNDYLLSLGHGRASCAAVASGDEWRPVDEG
jgi:hypothetical protein